MTGRCFALALAIATAGTIMLGARTACAQETVGAGKVEIDSALLGGGVLILPSSAPQPHGYLLDVATAANLTKRIGVEGDFAWSIRREQVVSLSGASAVLTATPHMLFYTANIVLNPLGHERRLVPYAEFGIGGMSVLSAPPTFGIESSSTHVEGNAGAGIRWFILPHWGARADYRYIFIGGVGDAPIGVEAIRHAQRLYGAVVLTF
jgi:hypothetical protein